MTSKLSLLFFLALLAAAVVATAQVPECRIAGILRGAPGVESVEVRVSHRRPTCRIIHILDWHFVERDDYDGDDYEAFLDEVRAVQASQVQLLRHLATHGMKSVFHEGLTDRDLPIYHLLVKHGDPLRLGAPGQLLGEIDVLAAEDEATYAAADPAVASLDGAENAAREAAVVRRLVDHGPRAVVVLGGAHDLSDEARAAGAEYVRVTVVGYPDE